MSNLGHAAHFLQHRDTIERLATTYRGKDGRDRVSWLAAFDAEPALEPVLLIGEGTRKQKIARLNGWFKRLHRPPPEPTAKRTTSYAGKRALCDILDQHYDQIMEACNAYHDHGKVQWKALLAANPGLVNTLGIDPAKHQPLLSFWYRTRIKKVRRSVSSAINRPALAQSQPNGLYQARYCSHCGHPIAAEALAGNVVETMLRGGMSHEQIVQTLTGAASALAKMSTP